ncbi:alkylhydroperoxidase/carboxymuconolactone decarboxylase family protein YurZ [Psychrobacillus insolitus]|uniref:Alkylhydroperoxidase/carboxymuconolactone decarboxylase family protein YurZ n=1 Tax=Psychrobacillus insolitus TaxID=1461 RepID=A0A2W7MH53_9BACI|nr:carboxymuconolactone decarboxylase family protein [Psychrobacillus insolitus]PZX04561.1 alkylhydroperoxidase/carboxymuconolactone decarboxylase family protein YurZ [Psychrobacillus insolitus]
MSKGLEYFKQVYGEVPGWVQKMHDYSPVVLDHYTAIRGEIMQDGALTRKEKDVLIAGMNAARLYPRSMVYHTKGAIDFGSTIPELVEYFLVAYLYGGNASLQVSLEALAYALELKGVQVEQPTTDLETVEALFDTMITWLGDEDTTFLVDSLEVIQSGDEAQIEAKLLGDGHVSTRLKHLAMVGNYTTQLRGADAAPWMEKARQAGASEADLADVGYICILTAGIPSWFELSDSLKLADK